MNYYPFHLGDYAAHTAHLEPLEDLAYRRMLDLYYLRECALPQESAEIARLIRLRSKVSEVESVLREFFTNNDGDGWIHSRCEAEIRRMQDKQAKAKTSADASVKARQAKAVRTHSEGTANVEQSLSERSTDAELPTPTPTPTPTTTPISPQGGKKSGAVGLKTWLESVKAKGEKAIPDDDPVIAYAEKVGIPQAFLRLAWFEFCHRYGQPDAKRYRDWRAVFRKAVQGNWLKLWFLDAASNEYGLTTVGHQAQRAHDDRRAA